MGSGLTAEIRGVNVQTSAVAAVSERGREGGREGEPHTFEYEVHSLIGWSA